MAAGVILPPPLSLPSFLPLKSLITLSNHTIRTLFCSLRPLIFTHLALIKSIALIIRAITALLRLSSSVATALKNL